MDEQCQLKANGLELITNKQSKADPLGEVDQPKLYSILKENFASRAFAVAWLDYEVLIGTWQGSDFRFYDNRPLNFKYVQRLRVFDANKEMHVWRTNGVWKARLRIDDEGDDMDVVVAHQLLFGTTPSALNGGFTEISEKRGTKLILPFSNLKVDDERNRIFIKTHNYVKPNAVHQASYVDCRFVAFTDDKYNELR
jgi:CRISPR-associated protein (TIGR03984 family)